jgi:GNAT superfamily N-acetyltransferase
MAPFTIEVDSSPDDADVKILHQGLDGHAFAQGGIAPPAPLAVFLYDDGGRIVGGVFARVWDGILDISLLWVHEDYRSEGYGSKLMAAVEAEGVRLGCARAELRTFDFQAPEFYKKLGYQEFLVSEEFPRGHTRYYFRKALQ